MDPLALNLDIGGRDRKPEARLGTVLCGKYRLDRVLGGGAMTAVYAATHRNQKRFAVKMLHLELSRNDGIRARFLQQGYAANSVKHAGAVTILDDDMAEDGSAFLVMELLEGRSVERLQRRTSGRMGFEAVLAIGHHLLGVLAAAHARSVIHLDINPAKLFVTIYGELKLLDFGASRIRTSTASDAWVTSEGALSGAPAYTAPEQALGMWEDVDARTDIWAVGATMFSLLTGEPVHEGDTPQVTLARSASTRARSLRHSLTAAPPSIVELVDRALAYERRGRWSSADEMRNAIRSSHVMIFGRDPSLAKLVATMTVGARACATAPMSQTLRIPALSAPTPEEGTLAAAWKPGTPPTNQSVSGWMGSAAIWVVALCLLGVPLVPRAMLSASRGGTAARLSQPRAPGTPLAPPLVEVAASAALDVPEAMESPPPREAVALPMTSLPRSERPARASALMVRAPSHANLKPSSPCNPDYVLDGEGHRHFKPECFPEDQ